MGKRDKTGNDGAGMKATPARPPSPRPLNSLHQDEGWTPEGLQAELEAEGLSVEGEAAKIRALLPSAMAKAAAIRRAADSLMPTRMDDMIAPSPFTKPFLVQSAAVAAGSPEWAEVSSGDRMASVFDLLNAKRSKDCMWVRVSGMSMRDKGIVDGSFVLVDKSREARSGDIVVAHIAGQGQVIKTLVRDGGETVLRSANPDFPDIKVAEDSELRIHGVAIGSAGKLG